MSSKLCFISSLVFSYPAYWIYCQFSRGLFLDFLSCDREMGLKFNTSNRFGSSLIHNRFRNFYRVLILFVEAQSSNAIQKFEHWSRVISQPTVKLHGADFNVTYKKVRYSVIQLYRRYLSNRWKLLNSFDISPY